nr:protein REVEILLE 6-like [Ipomoea trifida]
MGMAVANPDSISSPIVINSNTSPSSSYSDDSMKKVHKSYTITKSYRSRARPSPGTTSSSKLSNCLTAGLHANDTL